MTKKIIFRADGNSKMGLGHLYRLFAIAEMLKDDYSFVFLLKESSISTIFPSQYLIEFIPNEILLQDEPSWISKKYKSSDYIIVLDGYQFVSSYQKKIKELKYKLIYIDDLATEYMYADVVINHTNGFLENQYSGCEYVKYLTGSKYAMLRPDFLNEARKLNIRNITEVNSVFICFGGSDSNDYTYRCTEALISNLSINKINILIGAGYIGKRIFTLQEKNKKKITIRKELSSVEMINFAKECNLAIVPTSTICFELFALRTPIISGYYVDNQEKAYHLFNKQGGFWGIGHFKRFEFNKLNDFLLDIKFEKYLQTYKKNQSQIIDGDQRERYISIINELNLL